MANTVQIYSKTKITSIEVYNIVEDVKQLPLKYLSSYTLTLTEQQVSDLTSKGSVKVSITNFVQFNQAKYIKLTVGREIILLERQTEINGVATFGASFVLNPGMIQLIPRDETTAVLHMRDVTLSLLENDAGFITQDDVDLTNYYTKTETNGLIPTATSELTNDSDFLTTANADTKYAKLSLYGDNNINIGRAANSSIGSYSVALGGTDNIASGTNSVAIGSKITITGSHSFAAGSEITLEGNDSHAEGYQTSVSGDYSHAEGQYTEVTGNCSHAEGWLTQVTNNYSHAEGHHTIASGECQHVQGKYNREDAENVYAHIVGNGNYVSGIRSNAHTLDWNGNGWFAGDVYVGSTSGRNKDEGSKKLATEAYVDENIDNLAFKTLVHTDANPIDFNNITEPGVYVIKNIGQTTLNAPEFFTDVGNVIGFNVILIVTHKLSQESAVYTWQELICGNSSKTISNHYSRVGTGAWSELQIPAGQIKAGTLNAGILCPTPSSSMSNLQIANKEYVDAKFAELKTYVDNALAKVVFMADQESTEE